MLSFLLYFNQYTHLFCIIQKLALMTVWSEAPPLTARFLSPLSGWNPGLGMSGSFQSLGVRGWFSLGTPDSSTTHDWLVTM